MIFIDCGSTIKSNFYITRKEINRIVKVVEIQMGVLKKLEKLKK